MITLFLLLLGSAILLIVAVAGQRMLREQSQVQLVLAQRLSAMQPTADAPIRAELPWLAWIEARMPAFLVRNLARADKEIGARFLIGYGGALLVVVALGIGLAGLPGLMLALSIGLVAPLLWIKYLANRRMAAFVELLPHFLDSIRQLLMVGNSGQQALTRATQDSQEALRRYLDPAIRRIANGASVVDALDTVANRIDLTELHMVVAAVRTNQRTGGNIAPMLAGLAALLRDRARVVRELKAASAETRLSATVLCALPPVAFLLISVINYDYMRYMWETEGGRRLLLIGLGFQAVGVLTMRRLMRLNF
jgi:tight adherence protein B